MTLTGIVETVTEDSFIRAFDRMGRGDDFSIPARRALFEHYEQYAEDTGEPYELCVVGICCSWGEYDDISQFLDDCVDPDIVEEWKEEEDEDYFGDWESLTEWLQEVYSDRYAIPVYTYDTSGKVEDWKDVQTGILWGDY